jgi:hypothetical protein
MRSTTLSITFAAGLAVAAVAAHAAGTAQVSFVQPDKFADAGNARRDHDANLRALASHIEALAARHLGDGQKLSVEVLDVDLAGEMRFSRRLNDNIRVLKGGADWPRIKLRYTLESAGQAPRSGEQTIADMSYLQRLNRYPSDTQLRYEKRMLDDWFAAQFGAAAAK